MDINENKTGLSLSIVFYSEKKGRLFCQHDMHIIPNRENMQN